MQKLLLKFNSTMQAKSYEIIKALLGIQNISDIKDINLQNKHKAIFLMANTKSNINKKVSLLKQSTGSF